jgi:hypothetical protein
MPAISTTPTPAQNDTHWLSIVSDKVSELRYGVIQIVVHDSKVVQIERTEKIRLDHREGGARNE